MTVRNLRTFLAAERAERTPAPVAYVIAGRFNRSPIMREAVKLARSLRAGGATWQWRMRIALKTVWGWAKAAMAAAPAKSNTVLDVTPVRPAPVRIRRERLEAPRWRSRSWNDYAR